MHELIVSFTDMDKVVIVMPAYNEAKNIGAMIEELTGKIFPKITGADMHLLIVDDFSPDGTGEIIKKYQQKLSNLHLIQKPREGLGWAYVKGFRYAMTTLGADAVMEMDADFQHPPEFVIPMVKAYLQGADYCIGSRYIKGGSVPGSWGLFRKWISFFGNQFIRLVLLKPKYHDMTTGFRLTRVKGVMDQVDLEHLMELKMFAHKVDLFYRTSKLAKNVVEVPLEFAARTKDVSKFNTKEMIASFKVAVILGVKDKIRIVKFGIVGATGFVINLLFIRLFRHLGLTEVVVWIFATELAIVNNFLLNNIWTFKDSEIRGLKALAAKFLQFNLTSAGALVIQSVAGPIGTSIVGKQYDF
ncbi:MAG: glycosyltransferase family 2 protein, partial [Janthinobacterium sp.]